VTEVVSVSTGEGNTDHLAREKRVKISAASFAAVKVVMEEAASAEAMSLEKGMIVLSTAVAGGPFIGLLGRSGASCPPLPALRWPNRPV
jgi:biopolymer transport protein ExbB/TolQ